MNNFNLNDLTLQSYDDSDSGKSELAQIFTFDIDRIKNLQEPGAGIFFCINPQENPTERGIQNTASLKRLGLDLDVCKEKDHIAGNLIRNKKQQLVTILKGLPIPPQYIITTKNGLQPMWVF